MGSPVSTPPFPTQPKWEGRRPKSWELWLWRETSGSSLLCQSGTQQWLGHQLSSLHKDVRVNTATHLCELCLADKLERVDQGICKGISAERPLILKATACIETTLEMTSARGSGKMATTESLGNWVFKTITRTLKVAVPSTSKWQGRVPNLLPKRMKLKPSKLIRF